jgi:hypothetical protein
VTAILALLAAALQLLIRARRADADIAASQ